MEKKKKRELWWALGGLASKPCAVGVSNPFDAEKGKICCRLLEFCGARKPAISVLVHEGVRAA